MDQDPHHLRYKAEMTAALYVARGLEPSAEESFELHLMECPQCVDEVEAWRAIQKHMPAAAATAESPAQATPSAAAVAAVPAVTLRSAAAATPATAQATFRHWRLAAALVGIALVGAGAGWYGRMLADPGIATTAFFNAPALERGAPECTPL